MNHYDDLQRFKDKTRTQHLDFKDLSSQNHGSEQGNWAIINQLSPATEESTLAMGGHVSTAIPQAVNPEIFAVKETTPPADTVSHAVPGSAPVATSLLQDVASQLSAAPEPVSAPAPAVTPPPAPEPRAVAAAPQRPVAPAPTAAAVNFAQLFAPKVTETKPAAEKNQPLKSLLERIASCR